MLLTAIRFLNRLSSCSSYNRPLSISRINIPVLFRSLTLKSIDCKSSVAKSVSLTVKMPAAKKASTKRRSETVAAKHPDPFTAAAASAKKAKKSVDLDEKKNGAEEKDEENSVEIIDAIEAKTTKNDITTEVEKEEPKATEKVEVEEEEEVKPTPKSKPAAKASGKKPAAKKAKKASSDNDDDDEAEADEVESKSNVKYTKEEFKTASNGKPYNFKIVSWNINGIRAWLEKDGIEYLKAEEPDIFVCQETKCDKSKIPIKAELPNYQSYWLSGDTQGYSGVGLLTKVKPIKVTFGINSKKFDNEGRVICAEFEKFYLINTYIPNASRGLVRLPFRLEWEAEFRKFLADLDKKKPIIWCGDLNVAHNRIDIRNPDSNLRSAGFTVEERECFTNVLGDGYFDSFRYLYPERVQYTYWSYMRNSRASNIGWRLDYFVLSERLKPLLVDNMVREKVLGSDHCPIALCLNI